MDKNVTRMREIASDRPQLGPKSFDNGKKYTLKKQFSHSKKAKNLNSDLDVDEVCPQVIMPRNLK